jgi:hypothetical protein
MMRRLLFRNRRWLGMASVLAGAGMILVHYVDYGFTAHLTMPDHGMTGLLLVIAGVFLAIGKPDRRARRPGKKEES